MDLLARREHSTAELRRKLRDKGFDLVAVDEALEGLTRDKLLSDERFTEAFVRSRAGKGFGPLHIQAQLRERGIGNSLSADVVKLSAAEWRERAVEAQRKRFGQAIPEDYRERARQARFLEQRGFTAEQIRAVLHEGGESHSSQDGVL